MIEVLVLAAFVAFIFWAGWVAHDEFTADRTRALRAEIETLADIVRRDDVRELIRKHLDSEQKDRLGAIIGEYVA